MGNNGGYGRSVRVSLGIWQVPRVSLWQVRLVRVCCYMPCASFGTPALCLSSAAGTRALQCAPCPLL